MVKMDGSWYEEGGAPQAKYPSGWLISGADDPTKAQLVVCFERTNATPTGKTCPFTDENDKPFTLTMYNTRIPAARGGGPHGQGVVHDDRPGDVDDLPDRDRHRRGRGQDHVLHGGQTRRLPRPPQSVHPP
jgi:hypothetical protein